MRARLAVAAALLGTLGFIPAVSASSAPATPGCTREGALVLYDTSGEFGFLGERYATMTANVVSGFGAWTAEPVVGYTAGSMRCHTGVVYIGSTYDEPLPTAFLDDVAAGDTPVMWIRENLWQLAGRLPVVKGTGPDVRPFDRVVYKGQELGRSLPIDPGLTTDSLGAGAEVLAEARTKDGASAPWATRSGSLMYVAENPMLYLSGTDRYLAFNDLMFDVFAPEAPERHRALVRLEDVSPATEPELLEASVDALVEEGVPFAIALIAEYRNGDGTALLLRDRPKVVRVLRYAVEHGGTLVMHGTTHQADGLDNPYNGETAADYEYFRATLDAADNVVLQGPMENDTVAEWRTRMERGLDEIEAVGLPRPRVITPPHYAASPAAYEAMKGLFAARFDRGLYFDGQLGTGTPDTTRFFDQFFVYPVVDEHEMLVIPENLGNEAPSAQNNNAPRTVDDLVANAEANLVVRDGFAAFFWHPYLAGDPNVGVAHLHELVQRIEALGYRFVGLPDVVPNTSAFVGEIEVAWQPPPVKPYQVLIVVLAIWLPVRWWRKGRPNRLPSTMMGQVSQASFDLDLDDGGNPTFTVGEFAEAVNSALRRGFYEGVWIRGEIQGWREGPNGHAYFNLVDDTGGAKATVAVSFFANSRMKLRPMLQKHRLRLGDGMKVRIHGFPDYYAPTGRLGVKMSGIDPRYTLGEISLARDELIRRLVADGSYDAQRRLRFPLVPLRIGVVTSVGSAAWHDFTQELSTSGVSFTLFVCDARVQGDEAVAMVSAAVRSLGRSAAALELDAVVVVRGGGARSDLAAFDHELIARAVVSCPVPVLTGLGHEIDRSVTDEVAHRSLKTPTACAAALIEAVAAYRERTELAWQAISLAGGRSMDRSQRRLDELSHRIAVRTRGAVALADSRLARHAERIPVAARQGVTAEQRRIERAAGRLDPEARRHLRTSALVLDGFEGRVRALDPAAALARGWSLTRRADGTLVRSIADVATGDEITTMVFGGEIVSRVESTNGSEA